MKLWYLEIPEFADLDYNSHDAFVLWARTEAEARQLASGQHGNNKGDWLRPESSTCVPLSLDPPSEPTVVLGSFNAA